MDTRTGEILSPEEVKKRYGTQAPDHIKRMQLHPTVRQLKTKHIGRNDPCPCGSGKKFKKCCLGK